MPATTLAEIMGHSTIEITFRFYSKITDQMKQQEIEKIFAN